ncbi:premnaspirodiene oxygenase-like isoform X1 [Salvia splendens]|uniref:premnaspirodiene oxygenase-like isoform X1 n=1 Tax=Salvia splendens TaxID=180675 RepID=UPI001C253429|nr:premnaspirodiene oxygenase-like isoform X1 [Salvia splendens]
MEESDLLPWTMTVIFPLLILLLIKKWKKKSSANFPPGPKKVPIIGHLHLISNPPFRSFRDLARKYGPIMHLKLGQVDTIVVSSPEIVKEMLKDKDPVYADRPESIALNIFWYNYVDITFSPYGHYWRQMRKICILELLSAKNVRSFGFIRKDEVCRLVESLRLSGEEPVNLTDMVYLTLSSIICRAAFGKVLKDKEALMRLVSVALEMATGFLLADIFPSSVIANAVSWSTKRRLMVMRRKMDAIFDEIIREHESNGGGNGEFGNEDLVDVLLRVKESGDVDFPFGYDNIKAVILDMFTGGSETSSSSLDWVMTELMRNPRAMNKVQAEIRQVMKGRSHTSIEEDDIQKMKYLKLVIMESHRLHPQGSIIPRLSRESCQINGYTIPAKTKVLVNAWAIQRDPKYWTDPESFKPERFLNQPTLDFTGNDTRYMPFGSGKRVCPGIAFGSASVALPLAQLLHDFNWKLPHGVDAQDLNMIEHFGITSCRKYKLFVIATPYQPLP